ncbi:maleylpyruvate isomerase family mycothiol-dependent enzyme [Asanoa sp. NPDC050611]|uniref:maleylpyruvate isomerase family mycothiol-dependent enzyme n=1 Tax=Asanoa sp. NPDC050611 TaxID=3157098 RepID=UPI0033FBA57A
MDRETSWQVIAEQRLALADLLAGLSPAEWEKPSLCARWRVRDVAAHIAMTPRPPGPAVLARAALKARGSFDRLNHDLAVAYATERTTDDLVNELRTHATERKLPLVTNYRNVLLDVLIHLQDVAIPLGHRAPMPTDAARAAATRMWEMGWPFHARRRMRGYRLVATDADWSAGAGQEVQEPIATLLLRMSGRLT